VDADAVSFRFRDGTQINGVPVEQAVAAVVRWVQRRENASPTAENVQVELG
jgi:threonyl-tRNA synthetase